MSNNAQSPPTLYRSRVRTEPTNLTVPQYTAALWSRLENMIEEMAGCCDKVYTLEKVLKIKKDTVTHVVFLDETMKVVLRHSPFRAHLTKYQLLENTPSVSFWTSLSRSLEKHARDASKSKCVGKLVRIQSVYCILDSSFLQQTLSTGYPRLLRLFHEFFAKIAVHTDTIYTHKFQRYGSAVLHQHPRTQRSIVLRRC